MHAYFNILVQLTIPTYHVLLPQEASALRGFEQSFASSLDSRSDDTAALPPPTSYCDFSRAVYYL